MQAAGAAGAAGGVRIKTDDRPVSVSRRDTAASPAIADGVRPGDGDKCPGFRSSEPWTQVL